MSDEQYKAVETESGEGHRPTDDNPTTAVLPRKAPREIGGREGPDPTRFGDWEKNGRCIDF